MATFVFRLLAPRPNFALDMSEEEREIMSRHAAYWQPLIESNQMVIFGPVLDQTGSWGLGVVESDDEESLRAFAAGDPAVSTHTAHIEMGRMLAGFVRPGRPATDNTAAPSHASDVESIGQGYLGDPAVREEWDRRYAEQEQLWSGHPNGALVAEVAGLKPGRVLDVGCGEGADAVWLARGGWDVTALEVSGVALERAAGHARDAGVAVHWVHAGLADAVLPVAAFDLVSAQYPALLRTPDAAAERALLAAVAPGGVLLVVHHAGMDTQQMHDSGFDPADYVWPSMITALLDDDWEVELDEQRPRNTPDSGAGAHHAEDLVVRARRLR